MVSLNSINLGSINIGGVHTSDIKLGYPSSGQPELFPNNAWTVTEKSNSDTDRATIKNITGNGNDLVLNNFAYAENSGYGKWPFKINPTAAIFKNQPYGTAHFTVDIYGQTVNASINSTHFKFRVRGIEEGKTFTIRCTTTDVVQILKAFTVTENGTYEFEYENADIPFSVLFYNGLGDVNKRGDYYVDILQDPDYEGYLITDGVDDIIISTSSYVLPEQYTIVGDWKFLIDETKLCGFIHFGQLYVYNLLGGIIVYLNSSSTSTKIKDVKSLKAICSDGRAYDENWNEYSVFVGDRNNQKANLCIGGVNYGSAKFTQMAFKNASIYNNVLLTKDQCMRAYDYLQTIKN